MQIRWQVFYCAQPCAVIKPKGFTMSIATVSNTPAIIVVTGANVTERKLAIVASAGTYAAMALSAEKGKVGKAAQARTGLHGMAGVIDAACNSAYFPLAEYLAGITGESVSIKNRAAFESLEGVFESKLADVRATKAGGRTKKGMDNTKASGYVKALATVEGVQAAVREFHAARKVQRETALLASEAAV